MRYKSTSQVATRKTEYYIVKNRKLCTHTINDVLLFVFNDFFLNILTE